MYGYPMVLYDLDISAIFFEFEAPRRHRSPNVCWPIQEVFVSNNAHKSLTFVTTHQAYGTPQESW